MSRRWQRFEVCHTHGEDDIVVTGEAILGIPGRGGTWEADPEVTFQAVERDDETHARSTYEEWCAAHGLSREQISELEDELSEKALDQLAQREEPPDRYDERREREWDRDERRNWNDQ